MKFPRQKLTALHFSILALLFCAAASHGQDQLFWQLDKSIQKEEVTKLYLHPTEDLIATVQDMTWTRLWHPTVDEPLMYLGRHHLNISDVAFSLTDPYIATASWDGTLNVWSIETRKRVSKFIQHTSPFSAVAFSADGKLLAGASRNGSLRVYDTERWALVHEVFTQQINIGSIAFHPTEPWIAMTALNGYVQLWNVEKQALLGSRKLDNVGAQAVAFDYSGRFLAVGDTRNGRHLFHGHNLEYISSHEGVFESAGNMQMFFSGQLIKVSGEKRDTFYWRAFYKSSPNDAVVQSSPGLGALILPRSQFETGWEFLRRNIKGSEILGPLLQQSMIEEEQRIMTRVAASRKKVILPPNTITFDSYDVYEGIYTVSLNDSVHSFHIPRDEAKTLYENRQNVRIEAIEQLRSDLVGTEYMNVALIHPIQGTRYNLGIHKQLDALPRAATLPARLSMGQTLFTDSDCDNRLSAGERATLQISLQNEGEGPAQFVRVIGESGSNIQGLSANVGTIEPHSQSTITLTLTGGETLLDGNTEVTISALEINGFHADPIKVIVPTLAKKAPVLEVVDVGISDAQGRSTITPGMVVDVTLRIRNTGEGHADEVQVVVSPGSGVFLAATANPAQATLEIGALAPGAFRDVRIQAFANNEAEAFPLDVKLKAFKGQYQHEVGDLGLALMRPQRSIREMTIAARSLNEASDEAGVLQADIAINIPQAATENADAVAVIIGNRSYQAGTPQVAFALNDAQLTRRYVEEALGYRPGNILHVEDATLTNMRVLFGDATQRRGRLADLVKPGLSDVFVYYSGHGALPTRTKARPT